MASVWAPRARRRLAAKTWERDSVVYEKHIRPVLGELPIAAIDIEHLAEWQDGLEERVRLELFVGSRRVGPGKDRAGHGIRVLDEARASPG